MKRARRLLGTDWSGVVPVDFDEILRVLENPTRRRILERLVRESHYPLQLSKKLGVSQQAVVKHLKALEESGLVASAEEPSDLGGPNRRAYTARQGLIVQIDVGQGLFHAVMRSLDEDAPPPPDYAWADEALRGARTEGDPRRRVRIVADLVRKLNDEIESLDRRRAYLVSLKDASIQSVRGPVEDVLREYEERQVFYCLLDEGEAVPERISEALDLREKIVAELIRRIEEEFPVQWRSR